MKKAVIRHRGVREGAGMERMERERFDGIIIPENLSEYVRKGIQEGEKIYMKEKRKKRIKRFSAAAAAVIVFACAGVFATQPALASNIPIIRDIFKLLQGDYSYQGDLDSMAQKFEDSQSMGGHTSGEDGSALTGEKAVENETAQADLAYTKTVNGVTVSVSEAYCSVEAIYLSLMITSEEPFPDTMTDMEGKPILTLKGAADYSFRPSGMGEAQGYGSGAEGSLEGTFVNEHTYAGIYRIDIIDVVGNDDALKEKYRALESFDMKLTIDQIIGDKAEPEQLDLRGKTQEELDANTDDEWNAFMNEVTPADRNQYPNQYENWWFDGPFEFELPIKADRESAQVVTVDEMNDTGAGLYQVVRTKFEITVEEKCNEERAQSGVFMVVLDAQGKLLPSGSSSYADTYAVGGRDVSRVYVYVCDYTEYMDELKGYRDSADFKEILEERALYGKEIIF